MYARMIEGLGVIFTKSMEPSRTDYLIAVDVSDETSKKIVAARRCRPLCRPSATLRNLLRG